MRKKVAHYAVEPSQDVTFSEVKRQKESMFFVVLLP